MLLRAQVQGQRPDHDADPDPDDALAGGGGLFWKLIFNPTYGIFNYLLGFTNHPRRPDWLASPTWRCGRS